MDNKTIHSANLSMASINTCRLVLLQNHDTIKKIRHHTAERLQQPWLHCLFCLCWVSRKPGLYLLNVWVVISEGEGSARSTSPLHPLNRWEITRGFQFFIACFANSPLLPFWQNCPALSGPCSSFLAQPRKQVKFNSIYEPLRQVHLGSYEKSYKKVIWKRSYGKVHS